MSCVRILALGMVYLCPSQLHATAPQFAADIGQAMQDRDYKNAIGKIDEALKDEEAPRDYLTFLKGRAYHFQQRYDEAIQVFDQFARDFPESPWARRVRFAKAAAYARLNGFRDAEMIYRTEAEYLLSTDRKQEIAEIYLQFAHRYFQHDDESKSPDYQKALTFFEKAIEVAPNSKTRPETELLVGQCFQNLENWDEAINRFTQFVEKHSDHKLDIEARFRLGKCQHQQGQHDEARRTWQDLLAKHEDAASPLVAEAAYHVALTFQLPHPPSRVDLDLGVAALRGFVKKYPDHKLAGEAYLLIARSYQHLAQVEDAADALKQFLADRRYQDREETAEARFLLGQFYQMQERFDDALETWRDYLTKHPAHQRWSEAQQQVINTEYLMAAEQRDAKNFQAARNLWGAFLAKYPLDGRAPRILLSFGRMNYEQKEWDAAIEDWRRLVSKYPNTEPASRAQMAIAVTLEEKLDKLEEALKEYEKVTWGSQQGPAKQRAARLVAKQMSIRTERVFRTDEQPAIKLTSRNIEKVSVRAYKIDLETYFRKMHLATGVESLDIALIDPDETFEFEIPEYEKYKQTELDISLAALPEVTGGGVLVVTVSSEALEATTMAVQSDLDVIVKSSRDEVFVYAQNMRTGKPWPGARLLLSNGNKVFAEAKTADDGVFQESFDELQSTEDVRVFAVADQHTASNVIGLQGLGVAQGLANKGYLYTDRPVYRPGQTVNVRGIVRRVANDTYQIDEGKEFQLTVFDTRNRTIWQDDVKLNRFGSFHSTFLVPPDGSQGSYRIQISDNDQQQYQGSFAVQQFKLENIQLMIDTERSIFYRGEKIRGSITARYYYGAPLIGREIRYRLGNGRYFTGKTDDQGQLQFELETRDLRETQTMALQVELPEHNLATAKPLVIAAQGFSLSLSTPRPTYLSGESFEVTVNAVDAEGKPAARQLALSVLEQTAVDNRRGEQLVEKKQLQTDEEHGTARATFTLKKGAVYLLRAEGTDRFDNPVTGQHAVQISAEDDATRLRILASEHTYRVGDAPAIRVHWREQPAFALMTFQGAKVLGYRLVELRTGMNEIEVPMRADFAPNFELALAVMIDGPTTDGQEPGAGTKTRRFHHASSPFFVQRDLVVKLEKPQADAVTPGEDVEITITTTDRQGKPVSAEVSLAMIEQALMDRFGADVAEINSIFRDAMRQTAVRTTSSISFTYRPKTKAINERLLAEADRLVMEAEEESRLRMMVTPRIVARGERVDLFDADGDGAYASNGHAGDALGSNFFEDVQVERLDGRDMYAIRGSQRDVDRVQAIINEIEDESLQEMPSQGLGRQSYQLGGAGMMGGFGGGGFASGGGSSGALTTMDAFNRPANSPDAREWGALAKRRAGVGPATPQLGFGVEFNARMNDVRLATSPGIETWDEFAPSAANGITAYFKNGEVRQYSEDVLAMANNKLLGELQQAGAVLRPNAYAEETGYWNPSIVTDEEGKATVTFTIPERSTAWKLIAKGITLDTLAGESQEVLLAKKTLFGELKLPLSLTDGDSTQVLATVHNDAIKNGTIDVTLKTTIGEKTIEQTKQVDAADSVQHELAFDLQVNRPDGASDTSDVQARFEVVVKAGELTDRFQRSIPLQPFGMPVFDVASGVVDSDTTAWVGLPENMPASSPSLEIVIGPSVERGLLDILLAPALRCQIANQRIAPLSDSVTSDLMAAVALQQLFGKSRDAASPQAAAIDARIRSAIGQILSAQRDDGGWSWSGSGASDRYSSARTVWALALAERSGYEITAGVNTKALNYLRTQIAETANTDYESKAILLHAVAVADRGDFPLANRLYRNRQTLSTPALLHLALALANMDRLPLADDLLKLVSEARLQPALGRDARPSSGLPHGSAAEVRALYALALQSVSPNSTELAKQIEWLNTHRFGHRWAPDKATGPATLALCNWSGKSKYESDHFDLEVIVNDRRVANLSFDKDARTETVRVPGELLGRSKQRVNFRLTGRGRYSYQCIMEGFVAADRLESTTKDWRVQRFYEAAPLERDGKPVNRGFDVLQGSYTSFRNELNELPVGRRGHVTLNVWRPGVGSNVSPDQLEYLVVTEPLPSGVSVVEDSVSGGFERFEITPGAITFFIGNRRGIGTISYDVHGYLPGQYRAAPTVIRDAYQLDQFAVHEAKTVKVLPLGEQSSDEYRLSPRELYELGKWHFGRGEMQPAIRHLTELVEKWNLDAKVYQDATRMLLDAHLQTGPPQQVVRHFEVIKERWPEMEITYDKILRIGAAYHDIGEYERSYLIFRATVESSFLTESQVAGFLQSQDELTRSVDVMSSLVRDYPSEPYVAAATFDLAQQVYAMAPQARTNAKLREQKVTRVDLIQQAIDRLDGFLTAYPNDPAADKAAFSLATALLEIEQYQRAIGACERFVSRYSDSEDLDSFWYTIGYCHFALGHHTQALDVCRKVVEMKRRDVQSGRLVEAANHFRAIYILGQIYHSLGEAAQAIEQYSRVSERFADAKEAIDYFSHRDIKLPEVSTVEPGKPATVELSFRNVAQCETRVYRIDLMKFSLLRRDLSGITNINLAGISPLHEVTIQLGDGKDYRDRQHEMTLPLKEEGAYLVVCRGDDLHTSGLVLVTPLKVDVQEEPTSGRVRTTVKNTASDSYVADVHVKIIGSANDDFVSGETDLRGLFVADGIRGNATVIARADGGRYAFRRGSTYLGPPQEDAAQQGKTAGQSDRPAEPPSGPAGGKDELLKGIFGRNSGIMLDNSIRQKQQYFNDKAGVTVESVK